MLVTDCQTRKLAFDGETVSMHVEPLYKKRIPRQPSCDLSRGGSEAVKAFLAMCDSAWTENIPVEYPRGADGMIYTWFRENRTINQRHPYPDTLPCPETLSDSASVFPTLDVGSLAPRQKAETAADSAPETETTATTDLVQETRDSAAPISPLEILRMVSDKTVVECKVKRVNGRKADVEMFGITGTMKLPAKVNCKVGEVVKGKITRYNSGTLDLEWVKP